MSDDPVLKMYETQAELEKIKEEFKEIRNQYNELKNHLTFKNLIETVNEIQSKVDVLSTSFKEIRQTVTTLSNRVYNHDDKFSEVNENLKKLNETLNKDDTILSQHNEFSAKQNETTQVLNTNENNIGNRNFILSIYFQEKQTILLLGGEESGKGISNNLLMLENNEQNWKQLNIKLPYAAYYHGAQFLNNNLYIFGGGGKEGPLDYTYKFSKSLQWKKMAKMNQKHDEISNSSVILNNQIWVCGGYNKEEGTLKTVEMYNPLTNRWKYMKSMNTCRSHAAATVVNGKIFCAGGSFASSVECYDPSSDVWTFTCNMSQPIEGHGAVEMNGHLIIMGGYSRGCLNSVWALDTTNKSAVWIEKPSMSIKRHYFSIAKIHDKIFVCGGWGAKDSVEIFDGKVWRNGPEMPAYQCRAPTVVIPIKFARYLK